MRIVGPDVALATFSAILGTLENIKPAIGQNALRHIHDELVCVPAKCVQLHPTLLGQRFLTILRTLKILSQPSDKLHTT